MLATDHVEQITHMHKLAIAIACIIGCLNNNQTGNTFTQLAIYTISGITSCVEITDAIQVR